MWKLFEQAFDQLWMYGVYFYSLFVFYSNTNRALKSMKAIYIIRKLLKTNFLKLRSPFKWNIDFALILYFWSATVMCFSISFREASFSRLLGNKVLCSLYKITRGWSLNTDSICESFLLSRAKCVGLFKLLLLC